MNINIIDMQADLSISAPKVSKIVSQVILAEGHQCDEVTIHFVDKKTICKLHGDFFGDPSPTDCISFPMDLKEEGGSKVLGEVFVCPYTAIEYAKAHETNPYEETTLYIVHGLLHLMGYDDIATNDRKKMRKAEERCLKLLRNKNIALKGKVK